MTHTIWISVIVLSIFTIQEGYCLSCYTCSSKTNEGCMKPDKSKIQQKQCDKGTLNETRNLAKHVSDKFDKIFEVDIHHLDPQVPTSCLKQVTTIGNKEFVIRGCQLALSNGLDVCERVKKEDTKELHTDFCELCGGNGCNSASVKTFSFPLLFFILGIIYFIYE